MRWHIGEDGARWVQAGRFVLWADGAEFLITTGVLNDAGELDRATLVEGVADDPQAAALEALRRLLAEAWEVVESAPAEPGLPF